MRGHMSDIELKYIMARKYYTGEYPKCDTCC